MFYFTLGNIPPMFRYAAIQLIAVARKNDLRFAQDYRTIDALWTDSSTSHPACMATRLATTAGARAGSMDRT